ncbi:MAG: hypothetical protein KGM99_15820 [Burkholderiales bacterium]|nr:hypothetical protein [Burkholderiales bacterium]
MQRFGTVIALVLLSGIAVAAELVTRPEAARNSATIELPLLSGWYQGHRVFYISTDMSDQSMSRQTGTNYAPRLANALRATVPGQPSAVDRVYKFAEQAQGSVFASAPEPVGYRSASNAYTPLWVVYMVNWRAGAETRILHSEEEILDAEEKQLLTLTPTKIIVNCPIISSEIDLLPAGVRVHEHR